MEKTETTPIQQTVAFSVSFSEDRCPYVLNTEKTRKKNGNDTDLQSVLFQFVSVKIRVLCFEHGKDTEEEQKRHRFTIRAFSVCFSEDPCPMF